jgi:hypothetical protein
MHALCDIEPAQKIHNGKKAKRIRPSAEWLRQKYEVERLNCTQLARGLQVDSKTAWQWIREAGIETRKRGFGHPENWIKPGTPSRWKGHTASIETRIKIGAASKERWQHSEKMRNRRVWLHAVPPSSNPNWKGGITADRQALYNNQDWKKCARTVWVRDNGICQRCQLDYRTVDRKKVNLDLHHVDGFAVVERRTDPFNVILLCEPCHYWVHSKANTEKLFLGKGHE